MSAQLKLRDYHIGRKKARRYMNEMAIASIYPKMNLSKRQKYAEVVPYLLRNAVITRPNQAWSIDITYLPMKHRFLYLTAIIDWLAVVLSAGSSMILLIQGLLLRPVKRLSRLLNQKYLTLTKATNLLAMNTSSYSKTMASNRT